MTTISPSDLPVSFAFCGKLISINRRYTKEYKLSREYRLYKEQLSNHFALQWLGKEPIDFSVDVKVEATIWTQRDGDNILKPIFDALEYAAVLKNDKQVRDFILLRYKKKRSDTDSLIITLLPNQTIQSLIRGTK